MFFEKNNSGDNMNNSKKYIKTDLAIELLKENEFENNIKISNNIMVTKIHLDKDKSVLFKKPIGNYITISFDDIYKDKFEIIDVLKRELKRIIGDAKKILLVGLGNEKSTPDSLGPRVINEIYTSSDIYAISPGTYSGIDTFDYIEALSLKLNPNLIIIIDSLVSKSLDRINKTIQMSDTGISPGSGINNSKKEISYKTLKIPVIAIGTPTVVDAKTIVSDILNSDKFYIPEHYNFMVTPREIDFDIKNLSFIISEAINKTLYDNSL